VYIPRVAPAPASTEAPAPVTNEVVQRPDPGLGRGVWEARPTSVYVAGAVVLVATAVWGAARLGLIQRVRAAARARAKR